jgi:hypothetical protein
MWQSDLVNRGSYPKITSIDVSEKPTELAPVEELPIHVTAEINYRGIVKEVYLKWSKDSAIFNNRIELKLSGNGYRTVEPIPNFPVGTELYFKVFARASTGELTESYKFNYLYRKCNSSPPTVKATASKLSIIKGDSVQLIGAGAVRYEWNDGIKDSSFVKPQTTTTYKLIGKDAVSCVGFDSVTVTVSFPDYIQEHDINENRLSLFPNPATKEITITSEIELNNSVLQVFGTSGKLVYKTKFLGAKSATIDVSSFEQGVYQVRVISPDFDKTIGFIKQ